MVWRIFCRDVFGGSSLLDNLKMLVVLAGGPVATPLEACLGEKLEAEVIVGDLVGEVPRAVAVGLASGGLDEQCAVVEGLDVGVVERVDVDGQSTGVFR